MDTSSIEPMDPEQVKKELARCGITQKAAAEATGQSEALVSMVLTGKALSGPCLEKLTALIAQHNGQHSH